jgi:hypothetical protein
VLQRHILFAALKYPGIAAEQLRGEGPQCDGDQVERRIEPPSGSGRSVIFLRTRLFEQGDRLYLQSTITVANKSPVVALHWPLGAADGAQTGASVPNDPIVFAARVLPLTVLDNIGEAEERSRRLHEQPSEDSPFFEIPSSPNARFAFEVLEARADWMHVAVHFSYGMGADRVGWLQAHTLGDAASLKGAFAELSFLDALVGYNELIVPGLGEPNYDRVRAYTLGALSRYLDASKVFSESDARSQATVLRANTELLPQRADWTNAQLTQALSQYRVARELSPTYSAASNHTLACATALCARGACTVEQGDALHREYLKAIEVDPANAELLANLASFYAAASQGLIKTSLADNAIANQRRQLARAQTTSPAPR